MQKHTLHRTSHLLQRLMDGIDPNARLTIRELLQALGDRAFGIAVLIFSLPNSIPIPSPPGFSTLFGLPIIFLALQMIVGASKPWLPNFIADKSFSQETLHKVLDKAIPYVVRMEKILKPRFNYLSPKNAERVIGFFILVMAFVLSMPIPLGNFFPGLAITILALALLQSDGLVAMGGIILSAITAFVIGGAIFIAMKEIWIFLTGLL